MFKFGNKAHNAVIKSDIVTNFSLEAADAGHRGLFDKTDNFLQNDEISGKARNPSFAQATVADKNAGLNYPINSRHVTNAPITQELLDDLTSVGVPGIVNRAERDSVEDEVTREKLNLLIGKLDESLQQFAQNANEACIAASDYHAALFEAATSLEAIRPVVEMTALSRLTHTMIERTRTVEAEMRRRETEAALLRQSLPLSRAEIPVAAHAEGTVDDLTGLDGPVAFATALESEVRAARDAGEPLSIALCDIDGFKAINDTHGRDAGDRVIQAIARVLQRVTGDNCHVARHGGETFVMLFRGLMPAEAGEQLNRAREKFAQRKLVDRKTHNAIGSVTFSGGVADVFAYRDPREALQAADDALYAAKEQGRNRILVAPAKLA